MSTFPDLMKLDGALTRVGFHPLTNFWRETLRRWYEHPTARTLAACVGRGGVKSGTGSRVALNELLFGPWVVPPGEVHYFAFVSQNKGEASQRLRQLAEMLRALGVAHERSGDEIILPELSRGVRVFACQVGAVSGFRCFGFVADELCKWSNADHSANPAGEVIASLRAMTITHPQSRELLVSSPLATEDYLYERMAEGDTERQIVCSAPTWVANPSISEAETRAREADTRVWSREYLAVPQAALAAALDVDHIDVAVRAEPNPARWCQPIVAIDVSSGHGDTFVSLKAQWAWPMVGSPLDFTTTTTLGSDGADDIYEHDGLKYRRDECGRPIFKPGCERVQLPQIVFSRLDALDGKWFGRVSMTEIVAGIAEKAWQAGARLVASDQREDASLEAMFRAHGLRFRPFAWTNENKTQAVMRFRRLLADRQVVLPSDDALRRELLSFSEKVLPSGAISYGARSTGHDDRVAAILTALMADEAGELPGSPLRRPTGRNVVSYSDRGAA